MPAPHQDFPPLDPARKEAMRAMIEHAVAIERPRPNRLRVPVAAGLGAAVVLAGGSAVAYVVTQRPVTDTSVVHCFARAELTRDGEFAGVSVAATRVGGGPVPIHEAVGACAQAWRDGLLDPTAPVGASLPDPDPHRRSTVPSRLTVCVMADGSAAVVPGGPASCADLDLPLRQD